jgi:hypothetical protein
LSQGILRLAAAGLACWTIGASGAAEAALCAPAEAPKVAVTATETPIEEDRSQNIATLTKRMAGQGPDGPALGLTYSRLGTEVAYAMRAVPTGQGYCVSFERVDAQLTLSITVFFATELKPGSCIDGEAGRHEQKHVALERELLPVAKARVETALLKVAKRTATATTIEAAGDKLQQAARKAVDTVLNTFAAEKKARQLKFDTIEEYRKLSAACSADEIRLLLGG